MSVPTPGGAEQVTHQQMPVRRESEDVGDDDAENERLRRFAEGIDQPVVPGAATGDVTDGGQPPRGHRLVPVRQRHWCHQRDALIQLAVLDGVPPRAAVAYVRRHYDPRAGETPGQRRYVKRFLEA